MTETSIITSEPTPTTEVPPVPAPEVVAPLPAEQTIFVARTAVEYGESHRKMIEWFRGKRASVQAEQDEAQLNCDLAVKNKWKSEPWKRQIAKHRKRGEYYDKVVAALEAGFMIVPNMRMDAFAVKTRKSSPLSEHTTYRHGLVEATSGRIGEGEYVSQQANVKSYKATENGKEVTYYYADDFNTVDFPLDVAHPHILDRVGTAMELKAFDSIGVVRNGGGDPFVLGVIEPWHQYGHRVSFFLAWHLDVTTI